MTVPRRRLTLLLVALLLVDLVCCGLVVRAMVTGDELSRTGKLASAEVVDIDRETRRHVLVVRFLTYDRGEVTAGTTRYHKFEKEFGRTVLVRYDTNQPLRVQTVDWKPNRTPHWILLIVLAAGAVLLLRRFVRRVVAEHVGAARGEWPEDGAGMR
ncbi:hypothetical protein OG394_13810 [Kribbella sp. NBC_01245]|uniref:DUF3592 domain-containing protein n=1 Tax=Kribbella sp. NBC_01245 TaxID=2903578 RepID=UPI002E29A7E0|nr:DUF3592 domain-containing protein [Kribbella sp. NBC_01245]